jgi:hypothetical protein
VKLAAIRSGGPDWRLTVERLKGELHVIENAALKQYSPERKPRPAEHRHDYGQNPKPVLSFDLHKTLTPEWGFPLVSPPYDGVKAFLDQQVSRGACIHVASASLDNPDPDFSEARTRLVWAFVYEYGLPISWVGPNAEAALRIDDRGINVPSAPDVPDWQKSLPAQFNAQLAKTYYIDPKDNCYYRIENLTPVGTLIDEDTGYPDDEDVPQDQPRGLSTPLIDFDIHRTIMPAWGTKRDAPPDPAMVKLIRDLFYEGFSIQVSCAGWNPATQDDPQFAIDRAAWQRRYLRQWGIPYDRLVTKDDCDVWGDDKSFGFKSAKQIGPMIRAKLGPAIPWSSNDPINEPNAPIL